MECRQQETGRKEKAKAGGLKSRPYTGRREKRSEHRGRGEPSGDGRCTILANFREVFMRRVSAFALFVLIFAAGAFGQATPKESLLVLSKHDHTLAIVDPATLKVVAKMPVGADPHEVIATADGKMAYVSNYGGGGAGALHTLAVIDLVNQKALAPVDLGALRGPHGLDFAGGKVWFTAEAAKVFGSVDPASGKVDFVLGSGQNRTHMIFVTEDLSRIFT